MGIDQIAPSRAPRGSGAFEARPRRHLGPPFESLLPCVDAATGGFEQRRAKRPLAARPGGRREREIRDGTRGGLLRDSLER